MSGRIAAAFVAASVVFAFGATAVAQPEPDPSKQCKKGRTVGSGDSSADENGNGLVCVNQRTGEVSDDKEQFAPDENEYGLDQNGNAMLCYNPQADVVTDDDLDPETFESTCPPGFFHVPAILFS